MRLLTGYGLTTIDFSKYYKIFCVDDDGGEQVKKRKNDILICTEGFITKSDYKDGKYISLRLAEAICSIGFDGWMIPAGYFRDSGSAFHEEILLCDQ